jgi:uncharacterized membrane protein YvbJ
MDGYRNIYLQWTVTITFTYNRRYHGNFLPGTATTKSTYNGQLQKHLHIIDGYRNIYLQWQVAIT